MDAETQAKWDKWAEGIARKVFRQSLEPTVKGMAGVIGDLLAERDRRIADLEALVALQRAAAGAQRLRETA